MRRFRPTAPCLILLLVLSSTVLAQRILNPSPPMTREEATGVWVGLSERYAGVFRLVLGDEASGRLAYTPPREDAAGVDLYRLERWDQKADRVKLAFTPLGDDAPSIEVDGKISRRSFTLQVRRRGSARQTVRLVREGDLQAALRRLRDGMADR